MMPLYMYVYCNDLLRFGNDLLLWSPSAPTPRDIISVCQSYGPVAGMDILSQFGSQPYFSICQSSNGFIGEYTVNHRECQRFCWAVCFVLILVVICCESLKGENWQRSTCKEYVLVQGIDCLEGFLGHKSWLVQCTVSCIWCPSASGPLLVSMKGL